jgi:hypothetical protein
MKNISQLGLLFSIYGKIKNVPNHQPDKYMYLSLVGGSATHTKKICLSVVGLKGSFWPPGKPMTLGLVCL